GLVGRMPKVRDYRDERGRTCTHLAAVHYAQENAQEAEGLYRRAERDFRELGNSHPGGPEYRQPLAARLVNPGELLRHTKRPDDALSALKEGVDLLEALVKEKPGQPTYPRELARALHNLGVLDTQQKRLADAEKVHRRALAVRKTLAQKYPGEAAF